VSAAAALADGGACAPGLYPHSEALVRSVRDLARGRATTEAVEAERRRDRERLLAAQRESGLAPRADGMLDWQDLFRPLAAASEGMAAGPLVRFLDGNTFYRAIEVTGRPRLRAPLPAPELSEPWLGTLPSPFALAGAARHAVPAATLAESVLAPQIASWGGAGCALVVLSEPFLPREPERAEELLAALERLPRPVPLALRMPFADASPLLGALADAPVDAIGIDLLATPPDALPARFPKPILAGVVDAATSLLEEPRELARLARALGRRCGAPLVLTPNGDLEHVPETIAREKLRRLGAAASELRGET
jgi:5-methyltetrahydropteroyltriglutamate--homocysteine methyltransferase